MELGDNVYPRLGLIVQHCGSFQIHMRQLCPKNMCVLKKYQKIYFKFVESKDSFIHGLLWRFF